MSLAVHPPISPSAEAKEHSLISWLRSRGSVLVGFSGGVDSAYLACVALEVLGHGRVVAVIGRSSSYPEEQWRHARALADRHHLPLVEIDTHELEDPRYASNPVNRCYFCKSELWRRLVPMARKLGLAAVIDGTNSDDRGDYRPGSSAGSESQVLSPLAEVGLGKMEIRALSRRRDVAGWDRPASPCLASRIPYGTAVTAERLRMVETAERSLRSLGVVGDLRVRYHDDLARLEFGSEELSWWLEPSRCVLLLDAVRAAGFPRVSIDLTGFRSGSLNVLGGVVAE